MGAPCYTEGRDRIGAIGTARKSSAKEKQHRTLWLNPWLSACAASLQGPQLVTRLRMLSESQVRETLCDAIKRRQILQVRYQHVSDHEVCTHRLAPIDIGSPTAKSAGQKRQVWAYSYTHRDKHSRPDPKLCVFSISHFLAIEDIGKEFDPQEIIRICRAQMKNPALFGRQFSFCTDRNW